MRSKPLFTPDGRYLVVRGRLWRCSNPDLSHEERERLTRELMDARRAKGAAMRAGDGAAREAARARVDAAKVGLGERGPVWWTDGAPDLNRHMARTTVYAAWFSEAEARREGGSVTAEQEGKTREQSKASHKSEAGQGTGAKQKGETQEQADEPNEQDENKRRPG